MSAVPIKTMRYPILPLHNIYPIAYVDVLAQDCGNSAVNVLEFPQSPIWNITIRIFWEYSGMSQWEKVGFPAGSQNVAYLRQW